MKARGDLRQRRAASARPSSRSTTYRVGVARAFRRLPPEPPPEPPPLAGASSFAFLLPLCDNSPLSPLLSSSWLLCIPLSPRLCKTIAALLSSAAISLFSRKKHDTAAVAPWPPRLPQQKEQQQQRPRRQQQHVVEQSFPLPPFLPPSVARLLCQCSVESERESGEW